MTFIVKAFSYTHTNKCDLHVNDVGCDGDLIYICRFGSVVQVIPVKPGKTTKWDLYGYIPFIAALILMFEVQSIYTLALSTRYGCHQLQVCVSLLTYLTYPQINYTK